MFHKVRSLAAMGAVALAALSSAPASAIATFDAFASATLSIESVNNPDDLFVFTDAFVFDFDDFGFGLATATAAGDATNPGDPLLSQNASVSGTASPTPALPGSLAGAFFETDGFVEFENLGTETLELDLALSWAVGAVASVTTPGGESAFAEAFVDLSGAEFFSVIVDAFTDIGDVGGAETGVFEFSLSLAPGEFTDLTLLVDASGNGSSIPVPATLPLFGLAALGVGLGRLRLSAKSYI